MAVHRHAAPLLTSRGVVWYRGGVAVPDLKQLSGQLFEVARHHLPTYTFAVHDTDQPELYQGKAMAAAHHLRMMEALMRPELGNTLIIMPRGAGKTSVVQAWVEWLIGRASISGDKDWAKRIRILYLSHAAHRAYTVSLAIMQTIQHNPRFRAIFPNVKPSTEKWSQEEWRLAGNEGEQHANFVAGGINSPPLGGRFDYVLLDDIADKENMKTEFQRQDVVTTISDTIRPMLAPWTRFVMSCTRWHWDDPAAWAEARNWHEIYQKALVQDEEGNWQSYWPDRFSAKFLLKLREDDPAAFARQFQNEVAPEEGLAFERWWFQRRFDLLPSDELLRFESWDLASTQGRRSSHSVGIAMVVMRACPMCAGEPWHIFIPHMFRGQLPYGYLKPAMKDVYQLMGGYSTNHWITVEKKNVGEALAGEGLGEGYPIHFRGAVGEGQAAGLKDKNIMDVTEICRQGRVHLPSDMFLARQGASRSWMADFEKGLFSWEPGGPTDDVVSAFVQGVLEVEEYRRNYSKLFQEPRRLRYAPNDAYRAYA